MKINITKEEYGTLLDILYIADWVLHSHKIGTSAKTEEYRSLTQKLYSYAEKMGHKNLVEYSTTIGEYLPTKEYEETNESMKFIDEFENDTFWDELIERLVRRDLIRQEGEDNLSKMKIEEWFKKEDPFREMYSAEFEENGLNNISIGQVK